MRKHPVRMMVGTTVIVAALLLITVLMGNSPKLGLDLQGGVAVNLQPVKDGKVIDNVSPERLDQSIEIIRRRVDALGVAEPEVSRQGNTISVQLPGAKDQKEVLKVVGSTAQLEFRPVIAAVGQIPKGADRKKAEKTVEKLRKELAIPEGVTAAQILADEQAKQQAAIGDLTTPPAEGTPESTVPGAPDAGGDSAGPSSSVPPSTTVTSTTEASTGGGRSLTKVQAQAQDDAESTTTAPPTTEAPAAEPPKPLNQWGIDTSTKEFAELYQTEAQLNTELSPPDQMKADQEVTLATEEGVVYKLGPVAVDGRAVKGATAGLSQQGTWEVNPVFKGGANNIDKFNAIAAKCYAGAAECPDLGGGKGQLGIVLDGVVLSAPTINVPSFSADQINISGSFNQESAEQLAVALRYGSLPIQLAPQQAETVSPTLGKGALNAGIICGIIGLVLVLLYLTVYYRLLGIITALGTALLGGMLWVVMANLNAAVTLAGVVGIVVSIGTSLDSNIIFFEVLKEDVLNGKSLRSASDSSFKGAWSTILASDFASLIGAGVLYWLAIGPVRGFAFYLGVATILDLLVVYFFLRPAVYAIAHSEWGHNPRLFGIPLGRDDAGAVGAGNGGSAEPDPKSATKDVATASATTGEDS
ncbi:MAG TPA: protein translocase subunit SecD [Microthrixaceae bacterium]|nr:protein translocase subunit SecD [Microthrixaceae bacterium]